MKKLTLTTIAGALLALSASNVQAGILHFDDMIPPNGTPLYDSTTATAFGFDNQGFTFGNNINIYKESALAELDSTVSDSAVAYNEDWGEMVITRANNGTFSFTGLNIKYIEGSAAEVPAFIISVYKNGSVVDIEVNDKVVSWQNVSGNFTDVDKLVIKTNNGEGNFMIDNLNIAKTDVPEPESLALMLLGLPMIGWAARRKQ